MQILEEENGRKIKTPEGLARAKRRDKANVFYKRLKVYLKTTWPA